MLFKIPHGLPFQPPFPYYLDINMRKCASVSKIKAEEDRLRLITI